jgi:hypothetical protein
MGTYSFTFIQMLQDYSLIHQLMHLTIHPLSSPCTRNARTYPPTYPAWSLATAMKALQQ